MDNAQRRDGGVRGLPDSGQPADDSWYQCTDRKGNPVRPRRYSVGDADALLTACDDLRDAGPGHEVRRHDGVVIKVMQGPKDYSGWMGKIAKHNASLRSPT